MSEWKEVVNRRLHRHEKQSRGKARHWLRQPEWQCAKCYQRNFLSKDNCRECGKVKELQKDSYVDERSDRALAAPEQWREDLRGGSAHRTDRLKCLRRLGYS